MGVPKLYVEKSTREVVPATEEYCSHRIILPSGELTNSLERAFKEKVRKEEEINTGIKYNFTKPPAHHVSPKDQFHNGFDVDVANTPLPGTCDTEVNIKKDENMEKINVIGKIQVKLLQFATITGVISVATIVSGMLGRELLPLAVGGLAGSLHGIAVAIGGLLEKKKASYTGEKPEYWNAFKLHLTKALSGLTIGMYHKILGTSAE